MSDTDDTITFWYRGASHQISAMAAAATGYQVVVRHYPENILLQLSECPDCAWNSNEISTPSFPEDQLPIAS